MAPPKKITSFTDFIYVQNNFVSYVAMLKALTRFSSSNEILFRMQSIKETIGCSNNCCNLVEDENLQKFSIFFLKYYLLIKVIITNLIP